MYVSLSFLFLGLGCLVLGSHWLVKSLKNFSLYFGLKPLFLSIVVLGFVSSSPEWFVTMTASFKSLPDAALGNVIGSNVINVLLVLSLTGLFYKFSSDRQLIYFDMPILFLGSLILGLFSINKTIDGTESLFLLVLFSLYLLLLFKNRKIDSLEKKVYTPLKFSVFKSFRDLVLGFILLFLGSSLAVDSSLNIVENLSLSERFAGVFILSLSTSLPELAASLQAAFKKEGEMALGNIIGSNIFNTLFVLGSAGLFRPIQFSTEIFYDYFFMIFVILIFWLVLLLFKKIPKIIFSFFVLLYFLYIVFVTAF